MWVHRCRALFHAQVPLLYRALQGLGTGITNGQAEKGTQAEHDEKILAYAGNIGRFGGGKVKATLKIDLNPFVRWKGL